MDSIKTGKLISRLRKGKKLTQRDIAHRLNISPKTISKWECGMGCPDIGVLNELSEILGTTTCDLLEGEISVNKPDTGNLKKSKFYVCTHCGNIISGTSPADISCCSVKLKALSAQRVTDKAHDFEVSETDGEIYVHMEHEMTKQNYITFIAYVTADNICLKKLYPEQGVDVRFTKMGHGCIYCCDNCGKLLYKDI